MPLEISASSITLSKPILFSLQPQVRVVTFSALIVRLSLNLCSGGKKKAGMGSVERICVGPKFIKVRETERNRVLGQEPRGMASPGMQELTFI